MPPPGRGPHGGARVDRVARIVDPQRHPIALGRSRSTEQVPGRGADRRVGSTARRPAADNHRSAASLRPRPGPRLLREARVAADDRRPARPTAAARGLHAELPGGRIASVSVRVGLGHIWGMLHGIMAVTNGHPRIDESPGRPAQTAGTRRSRDAGLDFTRQRSQALMLLFWASGRRDGWWVGEVVVDLAGDVALQTAHDVELGQALFGPPLDIGPGRWVAAHPDQGNAP